MARILDIHTHREAPAPEAVVSLRLQCGEGSEIPELLPEQAYSAGIHPWDTTREIPESAWERLEELAGRPEVVAIGECGIDLMPGYGPLFRQMQIFRRHVEISESLGKPLIIHDVKAHDIIVGARRDLKPAQPWVIHGFRNKPEVAAMLLRAGCFISFGAEFNPETLLAVPDEAVFAETDESPLPISEIIARISAVKDKDMTDVIAANCARVIRL